MLFKDRLHLEDGIIAGILIREQFFLKIYDFNPNPEDLFLSSINREIYSTITKQYTDKGYPTAEEVYNKLILDNKAEGIKEQFISGPAKADPITDFNIVLKLLEDAIERKTKGFIEKVQKENIGGLEYAETIREGIDKILLEKFECYRKDTRSNEEKVSDVLTNIQKIREGNFSDYIPTGISRLDAAIIGIPKSHLTTIASRPGMGKTSLILQLKRNMVENGYRPLIISIEMSSDQLMIKDLSAYSRINSRKIESGNLSDDECSELTHAAKKIYKDNYFIEDDGNWTIEKLKATIRKYLIKRKIDIVFIDYLTLIRTHNRKDRYDLAVGEMTNSLREFAKETKLPIVIVSQLNRDCEKRIDKKPVLADLRESGSIEQDSKTVLFLFRAGYYGISSEHLNEYLTEDAEKISQEEFGEIIIAKCRNGKTGTVPVRYMPEVHLFENLVRKNESNEFMLPTDSKITMTSLIRQYEQ